jgi:hypothetical protein
MLVLYNLLSFDGFELKSSGVPTKHEDEMMKKLAVLFFMLAVNQNVFAAGVDCNKEESFPIISKIELQKVVEAKSAFIVDVNGDASYKKTHVPGAIHYGSHRSDFAKLLPADKNAMIVAYCGGPMCTAWHKAAMEACKLGYNNIQHFKDGISGWNKM